jgi:hypothetical protein
MRGHAPGYPMGYSAGSNPGYTPGYSPGYGSGLRPVPNEYPIPTGAPGAYTPIALGMTPPRAANTPPAAPSPPQFIRANWTQPQSGSAMQHNSARPSSSFFQPQQSFPMEMPGEMVTSSPMPVPDSNFASPNGYSEAPAWATEQMSSAPLTIPGTTTTVSPGMNASFGTSTPATQISSAPVVPAF